MITSSDGAPVIVKSNDMPEPAAPVALADRIAATNAFRIVDTFDNTSNCTDSSQRTVRSAGKCRRWASAARGILQRGQ
jgi:hypothetical protein